MSLLVVDASVVVKWFIPEIHSAEASRLLGRNALAPDLLLPEVGNILWKKIRLREITVREGRAITKALRRLPFDVIASSALLELAYEIATSLGRTVYDSTYLALAVLHRTALVTADRRFARAISGTRLAGHVLWVQDVP